MTADKLADVQMAVLDFDDSQPLLWNDVQGGLSTGCTVC